MGKSITSYDVAKAAGVSQSAVSRAFSPNASIAEKTREKILKIARELGYQPNAIARSMSTARKDPFQKSGIVGIIVTRMQDPFFAQTIAMVTRGLQSRGWHTLLFTVESETEVDSALSDLAQYKIDGVMILSSVLSQHMASFCQSHGIPVLLYNRKTEGLGVSAVQIEHEAGGRIAADVLCEAGHKRIAFLGGEKGDPYSEMRLTGFTKRLGEKGLTLYAREFGDYTFDSGREAALRMFSRSERPDAVFCGSDVMALGVLHAARHSLGLRVPEDFSLVGFDDIPAAAWPGHALTTIRQPVRRMIQEALEILIERMEDPDQSPRETKFSGTLILRDTVRRPEPATGA